MGRSSRKDRSKVDLSFLLRRQEYPELRDPDTFSLNMIADSITWVDRLASYYTADGAPGGTTLEAFLSWCHRQDVRELMERWKREEWDEVGSA